MKLLLTLKKVMEMDVANLVKYANKNKIPVTNGEDLETTRKEVINFISEEASKEAKKLEEDKENAVADALSQKDAKEEVEKKLKAAVKKAVTDSAKESTDEENLKKRTKQILIKAAEINENLNSFDTEEERQIAIDTFTAEYDAADLVDTLFPTLAADAADAPIASDLPLSEIITSLPVRVVDQMVRKALVKYKLMSLVNLTTVTNGIKQELYSDYRDADNTSGYSDVEVADYNMGIEQKFTETYPARIDIHKGYDILDTMLNDVTVTFGLFAAYINDFDIAISRPIAKRMYQRFVGFLGETTNFDEVITFSDQTDAKIKAKEIHNYLIGIQTASRDNLKVMPNGATRPLEYEQKLEETTLIFNAKYAVDYRYDVTANTFNIGEITLGVKKIMVLDFNKIATYIDDATLKAEFKKHQVLVYTDGVYQEIQHYDGTKIVDTPKLKKVLHKYLRVGNYRLKNKLLTAFQ